MSSIPDTTGVILVDHGSRQAAANDMLNEVVRMFKESTSVSIVEAAHMELADPALADAFAACVEQGATEIVIHPYFLAPGRHSKQDIPNMAKEAGALYPLIRYRVTEPLGIDGRMSEIILKRIGEALTEGEYVSD
jgi:sirohydrochlorin ferrochelatase